MRLQLVHLVCGHHCRMFHRYLRIEGVNQNSTLKYKAINFRTPHVHVKSSQLSVGPGEILFST